MIQSNDVAVKFTGLTGYPQKAPFDPPERYPEYKGQSIDPGNSVYAAVRETLVQLGLDKENFGTPNWNPLKEVIAPGMTVLVKPNTVRHYHITGKDIFSVIVHASVVRPMLDYICIALRNQGRIIIGDSQVLFGHWDEAWKIAQLSELLDWYKSAVPVPIEAMDFRIYRRVRTLLYGEWGRKKVEMDPRGYQAINLGKFSNFEGIDPEILRINVCSPKDMYEHHSLGRHDYVFPKSVLACDAIVSIPKFKTHRRTSVTLAIKNFMGLPAWKESLPHYMKGSPKEGGDQYPHSSWRKRVHTAVRDVAESSSFIPVKFIMTSLDKAIWATKNIVPFKDNVNQGMWYGNDTLWRTLLDINRAVFYSDKNGNIHPTVQRKFFCLMDGIVGGEGNGPIQCDPVYPGVLMAGYNPVAFDVVATSLMGFDVERTPVVKRGIETAQSSHPLFWGAVDTIRVLESGQAWALREFTDRYHLNFEPHPDWKGHVERSPSATSVGPQKDQRTKSAKTGH